MTIVKLMQLSPVGKLEGAGVVGAEEILGTNVGFAVGDLLPSAPIYVKIFCSPISSFFKVKVGLPQIDDPVTLNVEQVSSVNDILDVDTSTVKVMAVSASIGQ